MHRAGLNKNSSPAPLGYCLLVFWGASPEAKGQLSKSKAVLEAPVLMILALISPCLHPQSMGTETLCSVGFCSQEEPDSEQRRQAPLWRKWTQALHLPRTCCLGGYQLRACPSFLCYCSPLTALLKPACGNRHPAA